MKDLFLKNLMTINGRIADACKKFDRDADDITIVAVSKKFPAAYINIAAAAGIRNMGESRVQEAEEKLPEVGRVARFHMIGHLQTNKVKKAVELFDIIQSVDSLKLAEEISKRAAEIDRTIECLIEINSSGEEAKFGVKPELAMELIRQVNALPHINLTGIMTIGPNTDDKEQIRAAFKSCFDIYKSGYTIVGEQFDTLSMGMSNDFELAISEGSTMIRLGTALFGSRPTF